MMPFDYDPTLPGSIARALLSSGQSPLQVPDPAARAVGNVIAPNLMDYYRHPQGPKPQVLPSGKISSPDPRMGGVGSDVANLLSMPLGMGAAPEVGGEQAAGWLSRMGRYAGSAADRVTDTAGTAIGLGSAMNPTQAQAGEARPTILPEEQKQIDDLNLQLGVLQKKRDLTMRRAGGGPKTAGVAVGGIDTQIAGVNDAIQRIRDLVTKRQSDFDTRQSEAAKATAPLSVRNPNAMNAARATALLSSPMIGALLGYKGFHPLNRAAAGAVEGAAPNFGANVMDYATGGQARTQALENFNDPEWWKWAVGGESALGALGAHTGGHIGEALRTPTPGYKPPVPPTSGARSYVRGPDGKFISPNKK